MDNGSVTMMDESDLSPAQVRNLEKATDVKVLDRSELILAIFATHARGYDGIQTVPFDFTFNLGLRADTAAGGLQLGIANYLGFIPIRSGTQ